MTNDPATVTSANETGSSTVRFGGLTLAILCTAQLVLAVDVTVVNVANASIERALGFTSGNIQWIATAYALTFGGFLLLGGRMADLIGRRKLFCFGLAGFALTSLCAGLAHNTEELIGARLAQGLCAAVISPAVLSLLAAAFPEGRARQRAYGVWATAGSLGGLTGFLFGGFITSTLGWRWIFFINVPIAAISIAGALTLFSVTDGRSESRRRLDVPGAITVTSALALVIYGLGEAQSTSWGNPSTVVALCVAPVLLAAFFLIEHRAREPLLPFALLRRRAAFANVVSVFQQSIGASTAFLAPLFMQQVWGYSAGRAGAATIALPIGFGIASRLSSRFVSRFGPQRLIACGFACVAGGCALLTQVPDHGNYFLSFMPALLLRSFGQGLVLVPVVVTVTTGVDKKDQGIAAGLYNMSQQLGGAIGLAVVATVASAAASGASRIAGEANGIRVAFALCLGLSVVGGLVGIFGLKGHLTPASTVIDASDGRFSKSDAVPAGRSSAAASGTDRYAARRER